MPYLASDIITRVKRQFGDESGVQITDDDVLRWIQDALREIFLQNDDLNMTVFTQDTIAGQASYSAVASVVASPFGGIIRVEARQDAFSSYYPLKYMTQIEFEKTFIGWNGPDAITGTPQAYTRSLQSGSWNGGITVYPVPDIAVVGGLRISFSRNTNALSTPLAADQLDSIIHQDYFTVILEYCLMKAYELDENWEAADRKGQYVQSTLNLLGYKLNHPNTEVYPSISRTDEGYVL